MYYTYFAAVAPTEAKSGVFFCQKVVASAREEKAENDGKHKWLIGTRARASKSMKFYLPLNGKIYTEVYIVWVESFRCYFVNLFSKQCNLMLFPFSAGHTFFQLILNRYAPRASTTCDYTARSISILTGRQECQTSPHCFRCARLQRAQTNEYVYAHGDNDVRGRDEEDKSEGQECCHSQ